MKFENLKLDYHYRYSGKKYGFHRKNLIDALTKHDNVFVIIRDANLIMKIEKEYSYINVVPMYIYTDRDLIKKRLEKLKEQKKLTQNDIDLRLERLNLAFNDYVRHPSIYSEVIINNATMSDFHRIIDITISKYKNMPQIDEKLVFLLMSFNINNPNLQDYSDAIKRAVLKADSTLTCINLDDVQRGAYEISSEAKSQIRRCRIAIVDITENRPNVYYELGYVHGIAKDCILTCHNKDKPHFYPAGHKIIFYKNASELEKVLPNEINALIRGDQLKKNI